WERRRRSYTRRASSRLEPRLDRRQTGRPPAELAPRRHGHLSFSSTACHARRTQLYLGVVGRARCARQWTPAVKVAPFYVHSNAFRRAVGGGESESRSASHHP